MLFTILNLFFEFYDLIMYMCCCLWFPCDLHVIYSQHVLHHLCTFQMFWRQGLGFYLFVYFFCTGIKVSYMLIIQYFIKKCFLYLRKSSLLQRKRVNGLRFFLDGLECFSWFIGHWSDWNLFSERHMTEI